MCDTSSAESVQGEKVDVAVNIFAKPYQTSLSLLSLWQHSHRHLGIIWLQFEPFGCKYDTILPYHIVEYLREQLGAHCEVFQPNYWLDLNAFDPSRMHDNTYRLGVRYQYAFEHSQGRRLFLMHNDVLILRDIIGDLLASMDDSFAIGPLGQCWNCPANYAELTQNVMGCAPCTPYSYLQFRPSHEELCRLYALAHQRGVFARPYDAGLTDPIFKAQPWPLPECRINEWACLLDLKKTRPLCMPYGPDFPPGAYQKCGVINLDIAVAWFRDMHARGFHARHFDLKSHLRHWVGTGKTTPIKYAQAEDNAHRLLQRLFPSFLHWLEKRI